jgi:hypothetical protein
MQRGYRVAYSAEAEIVHVHDETPQKIFRRYQREAMALKRIFPHERFGLRDFLRLFPANVASDWYHAWHDGVLPQKVAEIVMFRLMQFWGTYTGFASHGGPTANLRRTFYYPANLARPQAPRRPGGRQIDYSREFTPGPLSEEVP